MGKKQKDPNVLFVYNVHLFMHLWLRGMLPGIFENMFRYAGNLHSYNTRYASNENLYKSG